MKKLALGLVMLTGLLNSQAGTVGKYSIELTSENVVCTFWDNLGEDRLYFVTCKNDDGYLENYLVTRQTFDLIEYNMAQGVSFWGVLEGGEPVDIITTENLDSALELRTENSEDYK